MSGSKDYQDLPQNEVEAQPGKKKKSIEDLARMGKYTLTVLTFIEFILLAGSGNMFYMIFAGAKPNRVSCLGDEISVSDVCDGTVNYRELAANCTLVPVYDFKSVNVEFGHFCGETALVKTSISVQMIGVLFGTILTGMLSDRFGRLKILSISYTFTMVLGFISIFAYDLTSFTIARVVQGPFVGGVIGTFLVYMTELVPKKHRFFVSTVIAWSSNFIIVSIIGWIAGDWRTFQKAIIVLSSPAFIFYWFVHESPRWLVQRGRLQEAKTILNEIQRCDGVNEDKSREIDELIDAEYQTQIASQNRRKNYSAKDLFHTKQLGTAIIVFSYGTFITSITNYSLVFNLDKLSGSIFINTLILAVIRWSVNLVCGVLDLKFKGFGRKLVHLISQAAIVVCVASVGIMFFFEIEKEYSTIVRVATILATAFSTQVFITKSITVMEIFPTVVRNQAMAFKSIFSRIGVVLAPQLFIVSPFPVFPYILLTIICIVDVVLFQTFLPETKGQPLPDALPNKEESVEMVEKA